MDVPAPKKGRLSLYEDLLSDNARAEIKARDDQAAADAAKKKKDAALMFKPQNLGKKSNNNTTKAKPKPNFSAMHKLSSSTSTATGDVSASLDSSDAIQASGTSQKRAFEDWLANDDDDEIEQYQRSRHDRGKKAKKWKKNKQAQQQQTWSYDDIYDPSKPVNFLQYAKSEAAFQSREAWKQRLYDANRRERQRSGQTVKARPGAEAVSPPRTSVMFAPPPDLSSYDDIRPLSTGSSPRRDGSDRDYDDMPRASFAKPPSFAPPASLAPPTANLDREESAEDAYARRLALSAGNTVPPVRPVAPPPPIQAIPPKTATPEELEKRAKAAQQIAALKAKMAAKAATTAPASTPDVKSASIPAVAASPPAIVPAGNYTQGSLDHSQPELQKPDQDTSSEVNVTPQTAISSATTISGAPTYNAEFPGVVPSMTTISGAPTYNPNFPGAATSMGRTTVASSASPGELTPLVGMEAQDEGPADNSDSAPSKAPGQTGFAERLLRKMGWEKGQGLGASNDGITTAIVMKAEKRKRVPNTNTYATPAMGKIVGGHKKRKGDESADETPYGNMSEVIKLEGMLANLDVEHEIQENNLLQEIGDEMGEQYGKVERLFIWRQRDGGGDEVFVRFVSQLSALRAVKGMDGVEFAGNMVKGKFWDTEKFERGEYGEDGAVVD